MATYVNNLRLKEITTGDESGTWGTSTNTNLELIADAFGSGTEGITTNADTHTTTIADGSADEGRAIYMKYTGTLDSACTITLAPNTVNKFWIVENATSGSQNIIISQGSGANITIGNGKVAAIFTDGAGSGAAVLDAFADLELSSTLTVAGASTLTGAVTAAAGITMTGTTPTLTIGDAGAEDTKIVFDGAAQDYYVGLDDTDDDLKIGLGSTVGTTSAITIDENQNTTITNDLQVSATGPHGIGYTASDYISLVVGGAFTSGGATTRAGGLVCRTVLTGAVGDTAILSTIGAGNAWGSSIATQGTDTNISVISTAYFSDPDITNNLASSGKPDIAATVYIADAPTEGDANYALCVDAGNARFDGDIDVDGTSNLDIVDIDGAVDMASTLAVGGAVTFTGSTTQSNGSADADILNIIVNSGTNLYYGVSDSSANRFSGSSNNYAFWGTSGADGIEFATNNTVRFAIDSAGDAKITGGYLSLAATEKLYLDGGGDTYIHESTANTIQLVTADSAVYTQTATGIGINDVTPDYELSVHGTTPEIRFVETGSGGSKMFSIEVEAGGVVNLAAPQSGQQIEMSTVGTTALLIDASQNLLAGPTVSNAYYGAYPKVQVEDVDGTASLSIFRDSNDANGPALYLGSSRGTSIGSDTIVQDDDHLGAIYFAAADGGDRGSIGAEISCFIDGTPGSNDVPSRLQFGTTPDGSSSPTYRMTILANGAVGISQASPAYTLDVQGTIRAGSSSSQGNVYIDCSNDANNAQLKFLSETTALASIGFHGGMHSGTSTILKIYQHAGSHATNDRLEIATSGGDIRLLPNDTLGFTCAAGGNVTIVGSLSKGSGSFKIDHPLPDKKDTHHLVHSFIEGPQADLIYRGSTDLVSGWAQVDLDDAAGMTEGTWELLCRDPQCWIQNDSGWDAVRGSVEGSVLTIECADSDSSDSVSWMVVAERCDPHIIETNWTDDSGRVIVEPEKPEPEEEV